MKIGDAVVCKKELSTAIGVCFYVGNRYKISGIGLVHDNEITVDSDIVNINGGYKYGFFLDDDWNFNDYFYTLKELRSKKLKQINRTL